MNHESEVVAMLMVIVLSVSMIIVPVVFGAVWKKLGILVTKNLSTWSIIGLGFFGFLGLFVVVWIETSLYILGADWSNQYSVVQLAVTGNSIAIMNAITAVFYIPSFALLFNSNSDKRSVS